MINRILHCCEKALKCEVGLSFYYFSPQTCLINSVIHELSCKLDGVMQQLGPYK